MKKIKAVQHRGLSAEEIICLENRGCSAEAWKKVRVSDVFNPERFLNVRFSGRVFIGSFNSDISLHSGRHHPSGIFNAWIDSCMIEDNVLILNIGECISEYRICTGAVVINTGKITAEPGSSFGGGVMVMAVNESGGMEVPLVSGLSAEQAYKAAFSGTNRKELSARASKMCSDKGTLGEGAKIENCGALHNVRVGPYARIHGAAYLENGTVDSCKEDPAEIGPGVTARNFLSSEGSRVSDYAQIESCYIGQGAEIGRGFTAEHSLFFANCEMFCGEAVSVLAGPFSVSHHKSSLLIACAVSFFNAGSGTNMSNHMYKTGPIHWGFLDRGCKTSSDSYLLWPSKIGAHTVIKGRHSYEINTQNLPFSYLYEEKGKSMLLPGVNMKTIGTYRDGVKWPNRDRRKVRKHDDIINTDIFNPYTAFRMLKGIMILKEIQESLYKRAHFAICCGVQIPHRAVDKGIGYYRMGLALYLGRLLNSRKWALPEMPPAEGLLQDIPEWIDAGGNVLPADSSLSAETEEIRLAARIIRYLYGDEADRQEYCIGKLKEEWKAGEQELARLYIADAERDYKLAGPEADPGKLKELRTSISSDLETRLKS